MTESSAISSLQDQISGVYADISQFLSDQKKLGNQTFSLSAKSLEKIHSWTEPAHSIVFRSQGSATSSVIVMDSTGSFYKGEAGQLLVKILGAVKLSPDDIYICTPDSEKILANSICFDSVDKILAFGEKAAQIVTGSRKTIDELQGKSVRFGGILTMPTYHPEQLLKWPELKRPVWEAIKQLISQGS